MTPLLPNAPPASPRQQPLPLLKKRLAPGITDDGSPVHSFRTLLDDLATIAKNRLTPRLPGAQTFNLITRPTPLQGKAFDLLGDPASNVPSSRSTLSSFLRR